MPELTPVHLAMLVSLLLVGFVFGWIYRSGRSTREKMSINAGWQAQIDSQQSEHDRLAGQNQSLMEQISQYQASIKDSKMRAQELSTSLKEAFQRRDELQRQLKDIRGNLEVAIAQRDKLKSAVDSNASRSEISGDELRQKDNKIKRLNRELANWQDRVPPLVERFRQRDLEAKDLETELQEALQRIEDLESMAPDDHTRIEDLEGMTRGSHTRIEPVDSSSLPEGLDASNEPHTDTSVHAVSVLEDQIEQGTPDESDDEDRDEPDSEMPEDQPEVDDDAEPEAAEPADEDRDEPDPEILEDQPAIDVDAEPQAAEAAEEANEDHRDSPARATEDTAESDAHYEAAENAAGSNSHEQIDEPADDSDGEFPNLLNDDYATGIYSQDDLKMIKGVGPAIEKTLNDLGIYRFNQIAEMSEYDIDRVAQQLKGFRSRIYREDWIGQARSLQYQKNND